MRSCEFVHGLTNTPESNLVTALELLRFRNKDQQTPAVISTNALINLVLNTDKTFSYDALVDANETNPAVKNLIKSFNRDKVVLNSVDNDFDETTNINQDSTQAPVDTVSSMAKRAAKERNAPLF